MDWPHYPLRQPHAFRSPWAHRGSSTCEDCGERYEVHDHSVDPPPHSFAPAEGSFARCQWDELIEAHETRAGFASLAEQLQVLAASVAACDIEGPGGVVCDLPAKHDGPHGGAL
jgi:hypothetical protein